MARFDVFQLAGNDSCPLVIDLQADLLSELNTRVVAPLLPFKDKEEKRMGRLQPILSVGGDEYIMMTTDISVLRTSELGNKVANLDHESFIITQALDFLFQGF